MLFNSSNLLFIKKKIQKIIQEIFVSIEWINWKSFIQQNRFIDIAPEHRFVVTLADFEQIINNDFMQLLNKINCFSRESNKSGITFA